MGGLHTRSGAVALEHSVHLVAAAGTTAESTSKACCGRACNGVVRGEMVSRLSEHRIRTAAWSVRTLAVWVSGVADGDRHAAHAELRHGVDKEFHYVPCNPT
jgi:hypothetical protein